MASKKNTTPGIGESVDSGVMHNPQPSRARTRTRVVSPTGILKESLLDIRRARTRTRGKRRFHRMACENLYTEKFQPCRGGEMQKRVDVFCRKERKERKGRIIHKFSQITTNQICADVC